MNTIKQCKLVVIVGATGVGKTEIALHIAEKVQSSIVSADSRQMYKGMLVGTASPTLEERKRVPHYFIENLALDQYYNARTYEDEAIELLEDLFQEQAIQILCGGSMLYVDAITQGIDDIPDVDPAIRASLLLRSKEEGMDNLRMQLKELDPAFYQATDIKNPKRILHGLEVCLTTGKPYSSFRKQRRKQRSFEIMKIGLERPREELYERINKRVHLMMEQGLLEEVEHFMPFQHLNALNTVGYKELFSYLNGNLSLPKAIEMIKQNTRHYAKKQITWYKKDLEINWYNPQNIEEIMHYLST